MQLVIFSQLELLSRVAKVHNLMDRIALKYVINTLDPTEEGSEGTVRNRYAVAQLFGEYNKEWRLPIQIRASDRVSTIHREDLMSEALCVTVFLADSEKLDWYYNSYWQGIIIWVTMIIILWIGIAGSETVVSQIVGWILGGLAEIAILKWLVYLVVSFALGYILSLAGNVIALQYGEKEARYFLIVVTLLMMSNTSGTYQNPFSNISGNISKAWENLLKNGVTYGSAITFLAAVMPVISMGLDYYFKEKQKDLERELKTMLRRFRDEQEEIDELMASLETGAWLDPFSLSSIGSTQMYAETPSEYYDRVLESNPGRVAIDTVTRFNELALVLPRNLDEINIVDGMMYEFGMQRGEYNG